MTCISGCGKPQAKFAAEENKGFCRSCIAKAKTPNKGKYRANRNPIYNFWLRMKSECYNKNNKDYRLVGATGVRVYQPWLESFDIFKDWAIANGFEEGSSFKRKNTVLDFHPKNLIIIRKPKNTYKFNEDELTTPEIFNLIKDRSTVSYYVFRKRLNRGWEIERAYSEPLMQIYKKVRVFGKEDNALGIVKVRVMNDRNARENQEL